MIPQRIRNAITDELRYVFRLLTKPKIVMHHGVAIDVTDDSISDQLRRVFYKGLYENDEAKLVLENLEDNDVVLEIGAGIGFISTLCAIRTGSGNVHCFEANKAIIPVIRRTYSLNGVCPNLHLGCVGPTDGEIEFTVNKEFVSSSVIQRDQNSLTEKVQSFSIIRLVQELKPSFLIVDVEGFETDIIVGEALTGVKKLCLEIHPHIIGNEKSTEVISSILKAGFYLCVDSSAGRVLFFAR